MKFIYPAIFHTEESSVWTEFPDLEGCQSFGDNIEEALENSREALEGYLITLLEESKKLPKACDITTINPGMSAFTTLIEAELSTRFAKQKSVKKTLSLPAWLNAAAEEAHVNFSAVLQKGLMDYLDIHN